MRALALALIAIVVTTFTALAADRVIHLRGGQFAYAIPKGSPVKFEKRMDVALLRFKGRFRLEGEYRYGRLSNDKKDEAAYDVIELTFVPDAKYLAKLPYWNGRGPVTELTFDNEKDFIGKVIGPELVSDVHERKRLSVTGRATIWVDRYTAAFDCDRATYSVRFLRVEKPPTVVASNDTVPSSCL